MGKSWGRVKRGWGREINGKVGRREIRKDGHKEKRKKGVRKREETMEETRGIDKEGRNKED